MHHFFTLKSCYLLVRFEGYVTLLQHVKDMLHFWLSAGVYTFWYRQIQYNQQFWDEERTYWSRLDSRTSLLKKSFICSFFVTLRFVSVPQVFNSTISCMTSFACDMPMNTWSWISTATLAAWCDSRECLVS